MGPTPLTPLHQCYFLGEEDIDPVLILTRYLIRNPQYARQRRPECELNIYVVAAPVSDRLACPPAFLRKITTTIGAIRAAATAITGEDFNRPPSSEAQIAARKAKKAAKKAKRVETRPPPG